jgi:Flp pilus assembly protein TadG
MKRKAGWLKRERRNERGQSLIETAVVLSVLLAAVLLFVHLANLFSTAEAVNQAAREAAHAAAVQQRLDQACAAAISYASSRLNAAGARQGSQITVLSYPPGSSVPQPTYVRGGRIVVQLVARIPLVGGASASYISRASELIRPGQARYPVRQAGRSCQATL